MGNDASNLHGSVPEKASISLLLIDVINDLEFPEGDRLLRYATPMARRLVELKNEAAKLGVPSIYVNDNFGRWRSDFTSLIDHCIGNDTRGSEIASSLRPGKSDYFVLKPKHSGFYSTTLDVLLRCLGSRTLIITGMAANICVLFTANDAYMRDYRLFVPEDCVASNSEEENEYALDQMRKVLKADTRPADRLIAWLRHRTPSPKG